MIQSASAKKTAISNAPSAIPAVVESLTSRYASANTATAHTKIQGTQPVVTPRSFSKTSCSTNANSKNSNGATIGSISMNIQPTTKPGREPRPFATYV